MKSVVIKLKEYARVSSGSEKELVKYILENPEQVIKMSIHQLAKETFTSASSIVRLTRKLGFEGFREMKKELIGEVTLRAHVAIPLQKEVKEGDSFKDIVDKTIYRHIASIEDTKSLLDFDILEKCVECINLANIIYLFGIGSSFLVAKDLQQKFLRLGKPCVAVEDYHMQILQAKGMKANDVGIIFSYSGKTKELLECCNAIQQQGATLISVTRFGNSEIANQADYNLYVTANEPLRRSGAMSSRISQLCIVDILYIAYISMQYDMSMRQIDKTYIKKE